MISVALLGTIYTAAAAKGGADRSKVRFVSAVSPELDVEATPAPVEAAIPVGHEPSATVVAMVEAEREVIVDPETGMRIGPLELRPAPEPEPEPAATRTRRPRPAPRPPVPRLHPNPGVHVIMVARQMNARGETVNGSCYRYISEVFERAGHEGWRNRRTVHGEHRDGPYADLGLIRTGDWLYIVNHPDRTPVGTHSVLFVSWSDRGRGIANVIEHPGWGGASTGRERTYDVSRTYRITRPVLNR